ncbi:MAG: hypothetical protein ABSF79_04880 [Smithellaceae bacterium]
MGGLIYPNEKAKLLKMLSPETLRIIQADYPFKKERNQKIYELVQRGASPTVLAEIIGGFSRTSVWKIGTTGKNS